MATRVSRRAPFRRSGSDRVLAGVAAGIAERIEIDPIVIRLAFIVLAFGGGFGVVVYLLAWLFAGEPVDLPIAEPETGLRRVVAVALVVAGLLVLLRTAHVWFTDAVAWSVGLGALGSAILWTRSDVGRARFARLTSRLPRSPVEMVTGRSRARFVLGTLMVVGGMSIFLVANTSFRTIGTVGFAVLVTTIGVSLAVGPWIFDLIRQLGDERRQRIRSEERAEVAAHLHDSVLQTLAMIQRAPSPEEMTTLARAQERELRAWLYGRAPTGEGKMLREALDAMAARVERVHRVAIDVVTVGDVAVDDRVRALIDAVGEATTNAAKHSGAKTVSIYAEVSGDAVNVFVRDEGKGFDIDERPAGRRGISESIVGRMDRNGGSATVSSSPSEGTEIHLTLPRRPS
ncbi:MAG TPA: PspC domain-containing protein [Actinomycetota bacterium]|nr:PspC domain-containing protein [Actinomycetota bacterium]